MFGDQNTNMKMVEAAGMGIILHYPDITKDNILKALRTVLDNTRCNTKTFLCTYSVDLYYSKVTTFTNIDIKNTKGNKCVNKMKVNRPNILTVRTLEMLIP